jgi:hypothetical protein
MMTVVVNQLVAGTSKGEALAMGRFDKDDLGISRKILEILRE